MGFRLREAGCFGRRFEGITGFFGREQWPEWRGGDGAEAAFAVVEVAEGGGEIGLIEVGPNAVSEDELGVCGFPEKEIGEALFATCADEQVEIAAVRGQLTCDNVA